MKEIEMSQEIVETLKKFDRIRKDTKQVNAIRSYRDVSVGRKEKTIIGFQKWST